MKYLLLLGVIAGLSYPAFGHQGGGDSYLHLTIKEDAIQAKLGISLRTLSQTTAFDDDGNYKVTADEMQRHLDAIADYALSRLMFSVSDTPCNAKHVKQEALGRFAIISFAPNCPTPFRSITIAYGLFFDVDPLHRGLLRLEHQERTHTAIFTSAQRTQHIQLVQSSLWRQFWDYISVDPPAELTGLLPYLGNPFWAFIEHRWDRAAWFYWSSLDAREDPSARSRWLEIAPFPGKARHPLLLVPRLPVHHAGCGETLSEARQEGIAMQRAISVTANLSQPLRQHLAVAEPSDLAYQEQIEALREAVLFLARREGDANTDLTSALEQLAQGQSQPALTMLQRVAEQTSASGQISEAATIHCHRGAIAALMDLDHAIEAYREATILDPRSWRAWDRLGYVLRQAHRLSEAKLAYTEMLELGHAAKDEAQVALAHEYLGEVSQARGNAEEAETRYQAALRMHRARRDEASLARVSRQLGDLYATQGKFNEAQALYRDALAIHETLGDKTRVAVDYANLGGVYIAQGAFRQGTEMYHEALKINKALGRKAGMALVYADLGWMAQRRGHWRAAERMFHEALRLDKALGYTPGMAANYTHLGEVYRWQGNLAQAVTMFRKALALDKDLGNTMGLAANYINLGFLYQRHGDLDKAESMYKQALALNEELDRPGVQASLYGELGHVYRSRGDWEHARAMYRKSQALFHSVGAKQSAREIQTWLDGLKRVSLAQ